MLCDYSTVIGVIGKVAGRSLQLVNATKIAFRVVGMQVTILLQHSRLWSLA